MKLISQQKFELSELIKSITVLASPLKIVSLNPWDTTKEVAKRTAFTSATRGEHNRSKQV